MSVPTFDELHTDLMERWRRAWDRVGEIDVKVPVATVYTEYPAFGLEGYTPKRFKAGARLMKAKTTDTRCVYELDTAGRPVKHREDSDVRGVYHYATNEVEHIEWNVKTGVPWLYDRLTLDETGAILTEQRYVVHSRGDRPAWVRAHRDQVIGEIVGDHYNFVYLWRYHVENGVTRSGEEYQHTNRGIDVARLEYTYAPDGKLQRIVQHWETGSRTTFAAKSKTTTKELTEQVVSKLSEAVLAALRESTFDAPLALLELSYRDGERYVPLLVPMTTADETSGLTLAAEIDAKRWLALDDNTAAPELTELEQRAGESGTALVKMLRSVARTVTERARAELPVTPDFVAFAIDWEIEGEKLKKILGECGASAEQLRAWKKQRWL